MTLTSYLILLLLQTTVQMHQMSNIYNLTRQIGPHTTKEFETSTDSFYVTPGFTKSCQQLNGVCTNHDCDVCKCAEDETFFSYDHGCMTNDDVYNILGGVYIKYGKIT